MKNKFKAIYAGDNKTYMVSTMFFDKEFNVYSVDLIDKKENKKCFQASIKEVKLMQATGVPDQDGVEIYVGDYCQAWTNSKKLYTIEDNELRLYGGGNKNECVKGFVEIDSAGLSLHGYYFTDLKNIKVLYEQ